MTFVKEETLRISKGIVLGALRTEILEDSMLSKDLSNVFFFRDCTEGVSFIFFLKDFPYTFSLRNVHKALTLPKLLCS